MTDTRLQKQSTKQRRKARGVLIKDRNLVIKRTSEITQKDKDSVLKEGRKNRGES